MFEIPGMPGASMGAINIGDMLGKPCRASAANRAASACATHMRPYSPRNPTSS